MPQPSCPDGLPSADDADLSRRLQVLFNGLPAMIGYWDRDLHNVIANDAYFEIFGLTPQQLRGRHMRDVLGPEVFAKNLPYVEAVLAGEPQLFDRTLVDQMGRTRHTQASYLPDVVDGEVQGFYVLVTDVTARVEAERERDEARSILEISMTNAPFGHAVIDMSGRMVHVNPALCELIGYPEDELVGRDFREFIHPADVPTADADFAKLVDGLVSRQVASERRYIRRDGTIIWMQRNAVLVAGSQDVIVAQFQDVTARKHAERELARLAVTDSLTGLGDRHALVACVEQHRRAGAPIGVLFVDLDGFKQVNDGHGHAVGDEVLVQAAQRLKAAVAAPSSVYRLGGDEFVALVGDPDEPAVVAQLAARIRDELTGEYTVDSVRVTLSASVGWTYGPAEDVDELIRKADSEMYRHKARRRVS